MTWIYIVLSIWGGFLLGFFTASLCAVAKDD